jgi:hypothetical protein
MSDFWQSRLAIYKHTRFQCQSRFLGASNANWDVGWLIRGPVRLKCSKMQVVRCESRLIALIRLYISIIWLYRYTVPRGWEAGKSDSSLLATEGILILDKRVFCVSLRCQLLALDFDTRSNCSTCLPPALLALPMDFSLST